MTTMTATNLRSNLFEVFSNTAKYNDVITVPTKEGSVVILSEADYHSMMETLYLYSQPGVVKEILEADKEPLSECIPEEEVEW